MKCKKVRILLSASLDGELSRSEEAAVERHLFRCAECAREQAELSALRDSMSLWADEEPSAWLSEKFAYKLQRLQEGTVGTSRRTRSRRRILGTAAAGFAASLFLLGLLLHSQFQPPVPLDIESPSATTEVREPEQPESSRPADGLAKQGAGPAPAQERPLPPVEREQARPQEIVQSAPSPTHVATRLERKPYVRPVHRPMRKQVSEDRPEPGYTGLASMPEAEQVIIRKFAAAGIAQGAVAEKVSDNLGEAGLAMNETVERVRGNLQKAVDLIISTYPAPASDDVYLDGGNTL